MQSENVDESLIESYLGVLRNLSNDMKLEIISKLSESMKGEQKEENSAKYLFGGFVTEKSAEELIEEIRQARVFNREVEDF